MNQLTENTAPRPVLIVTPLTLWKNSPTGQLQWEKPGTTTSKSKVFSQMKLLIGGKKATAASVT